MKNKITLMSMCSLFLNSYSGGMYKKQEQESVDQKCTFNALPIELQEHIISYLPVDNLYRALWLRCHVAAQKFYDDTIKVYLESHHVPQELIDKVIAKDFATFCNKVAGKQEFKEKITRALKYYGQSDTDLIRRYQEKIKIERLQDNWNLAIINLPLPPLPEQVLWYIGRDDVYGQFQAELTRFKEEGTLIHCKKKLQKYHAYLMHCKTIFFKQLPKTIMRDMLYKLNVRLTGLNIAEKYDLVASGMLPLLFSLGMFREARQGLLITNGQTELVDFLKFVMYMHLYLALTLVGMVLSAHAGQKIIPYVCDKFIPYYRYILLLEDLIEYQQKKLSHILNAIDQVQRT